MPGTTATQGLIYPEDSDRACEGATQLEVLAKGINGRLSVLDALVDTGEAPPMVLVEWISEEDVLLSEVDGGNGIIWNTVVLDDADAFDTGVSAISIKLPYTAPGQLWEVGCYLRINWDGPGGSTIVSYSVGLRISDSLGNVIHWADEQRYTAASHGGGGGSIVTMYETSGEDTIAAEIDFTAFDGSVASLERAQLWAIKVAEA